jgi:hypothetical protein
MSTRNLPVGKELPVRKADSLTAICERIVYKMWESRCLTALWDSTACYKDSFTLLLLTDLLGLLLLFLYHYIFVKNLYYFSTDLPQ